ncbi:hypothetical protein GUJ93_ZPchr0010g10430 [Zizania palustris]|uniref:Uncharacterized protein n=1 Tax=Zizania palustris TaxID=103762 RepID=A0A8J5WBR3_ZIZPA|nr:hypothetical protein GUJ93_ZPchr0010g10430 [Zizania palustris]
MVGAMVHPHRRLAPIRRTVPARVHGVHPILPLATNLTSVRTNPSSSHDSRVPTQRGKKTWEKKMLGVGWRGKARWSWSRRSSPRKETKRSRSVRARGEGCGLAGGEERARERLAHRSLSVRRASARIEGL